MNRKKFISLTIVAMIVLQLFMPSNLTFGETGADVSGRIDDSKTETSIKIYNGEVIVSPNEARQYLDVQKDARLEINAHIFLLNHDGVGDEPTPYNYNRGDYFYIDLPESINFSIPESGIELKNNNGDLVGNLTLEGTKVKVTFTDYVQNKSDIEVKFNISGVFKEAIVNDTSVDQISIEFSGKIIAKVYFKIENINISLVKNGVVDVLNNMITWTIDLTPEEDKIVKGVVFKDTYSDNQEFVEGSFKVNSVTTSAAITSSGNGLEYTFIDSITGKQTIEYKTKIKDSSFSSENGITEKVTYKNSVIASFNGTDSPKEEAELSLDWVNKTGVLADNDTKIKWTVEINNIDKFLDSKAPLIQDTLDSNIILVEDNNFPVQIKFDNSQAVTVTTTDAGFGYYSKEGSELKYHFNSDAASFDKAVLTYYTDINNPNADNNNNTTYYNTAELIWGENQTGPSDTAGIGIGKGIIQKSAGIKFNYWDNKEINWKVYINKNRVSITNAEFMDTLPVGVTYKEGSFKLNGIVVLPTTSGSTISYAIGNINTPQTITYTTTINNNYPGLYKNGDVTFTNNVQLTGGGIYTGKQTDNSTQVVGNEVISKGVDVNYNYNTRIVKWKIIVNKNEIPLENVSISDVIPLGMEFLDDTFKVDGNLIVLDANKYVINGIDDIVNKDSFTYNLGNINEQHVITFDTKVKEKYLLQTSLLNKTLTFTNSANISAEGYTNKPSATAKATVNNSIVKKTGTRIGLDSVKWAVTINNNKLLISNVIISDVLQEGLTLDLASVELYAAVINDLGVLTKGSKITDTSMYLASYDESTRTFEFKFLNTIHEAYVLEFVTDVLVDYVKIENTINFSGSGQTVSNDSASLIVNINNWDGSGSASNGSFTINKINSNNEPLTGAEFKVKDKLNKIYTLTETVEGNIVYVSLPYRLYYIEETKAPEGYLLDKTIKIVKVSNASGSAIEIVNQKAVADVKLIKQNEEKLPLKGAEFTLYEVVDGGEQVVVGTPVTSNSNGEISFTDVEPGYYTIVETNPPTGYKQADDIDVEVRISDDGTMTEVVFNGGSVSQEPFIVTNTRVYQAIELTKTDESGNPLEGVEFELRIDDGQGNYNVVSGYGNLKTNTDGKIYVGDSLTPGNYQLIETKAKDGYWLDTNPIDFNVMKDQITPTSKTVVNTRQGNLIIKKVDAADQKPLIGAVFKLYLNYDTAFDEPLFISSASDEDGFAIFTNVKYGDYILKEITAPEGYVVNLEDYANNITINSESKEVIIENELINQAVRLTKVDSEDSSIKLSGAKFTLHKQDGTLVTKDKNGFDFPEKFITGENGEITLNNLISGIYYFMEKEASKYYLLPAGENQRKTDEFTISAGQTVFTDVEKKNTRGIGDIIITKVDDADNSVLINDVVFTLKKGDLVVRAKTTVDGKAEFTGLPYGQYTLTETTANESYVLNNSPLSILLDGNTDGIKIELTIENTKKDYSVKLVKYNASKSQKLSGAVFQLKKQIDSVYVVVEGIDDAKLTTDENGEISLKDLGEGKYQLIETKAPSGYRLNIDPVEFEITENQTVPVEVEKINSKSSSGGGGQTNTPVEPVTPVDPVTPVEPVVPVVTPNNKVANIFINKIDSDSNPLQGAEFIVYDEKNEVIRTVVSDENGKVLFDNLPFGKYFVKETSAPEGYELISDVKIIEITESKTYSYNFINVLSEALIDDPDVPKGWENIEDPIVPEGQVTLPDTGSILNTWILIAIGIMLILAGAVMIKRKIIG